MSHRRCGGMTLLEIMIVLAIVLVLAAISYTVALSAVGAAKSSACMSNLSSIWKATSLYAADHDGLIPPHAFEAYGSFIPNQPEFKKLVSPYGAVDSAFYCPADRHARTNFQGEFYSFAHTSYWMGWRVYFDASSGPGGAMLFHLDLSKNPAEAMLFADQPWIQEGDNGSQTRLTSHGTMQNAVFVDGHAKTVKVVQP